MIAYVLLVIALLGPIVPDHEKDRTTVGAAQPENHIRGQTALFVPPASCEVRLPLLVALAQLQPTLSSHEDANVRSERIITPTHDWVDPPKGTGQPA